MIDKRMLALASALALFVPTAAFALPGPWPGDDPSRLVVEGGAGEFVNVTDVTLVRPPGPTVIDPNTTLGTEQLVEGHTVFATIDIVRHVVQTEGSINISAFLQCGAQTGVDYDNSFFGIPIPYRVHSSSAQCIENATLVAVPNPVPPLSASVHFTPLVQDGVVIPFTTPTGQRGYEIEYSYQMRVLGDDGVWHESTRYAWGASPTTPWIDESGATKDLFLSLPTARLVEMGVRDFSVVDARTLDIST